MASSITEAQAELISSLTPDDIPHKLRCANCSKLAVNAFRLPCCEQAICESCHSSLPSSCPVCEHSPLSADDCTPNKSLRTTIKVFLRTAEKKREANKPKEVAEPAPETPVEAAPAQSFVNNQAASAGDEATNGAQSLNGGSMEASPVPPATVAQVDSDNTQQQAEVADAQQRESNANTAENAEEDNDDDTDEDSDDDVIITTKRPEQPPQQNEEEYGEDDDQGEGEDDNGQGQGGNGFSNQVFPGGGDFNQMQMMMAMQNNMGFPMMGMPGMNMDPMMMQNMFMNGGFQGMGMNGMGGFGGGFDNNWNGSQSWNFDQNNFNQNGAGMNTGDFGNFNSGFQTGYNQGNYGQYNNYRQNNYRGRGRGRGYYGGGYGRGGFQQGGHYHGQNQLQQGQNEGTAQSILQASNQGDSQSVNQDNAESQPPDAPVNAPTGPKAMRQGLPNTSLHHLRARGFQVGEGGTDGSVDGQSRSQYDDAERDVDGADHRSAPGDQDQSQSQSQPRG
ncbi:hypothetical protein NLG97_g9604 [Lecanicillium saksenae]|uniref:Uncharacterized protein n=1 Tax=Lecanicillium saksenae TaxID=468837 RepID=A0ACC1QFI3_9HYPO|nr:hypothetical protein NLG97_g9604 [Lecanicillium saksenae]